jgi:hypothetical protein
VLACPLVLVGVIYTQSDPAGYPLRAEISNPTNVTYTIDTPVELRLDRAGQDGYPKQGNFASYPVLEDPPKIKGGSVAAVPIKGPWNTDIGQYVGDAKLHCHAGKTAAGTPW